MTHPLSRQPMIEHNRASAATNRYARDPENSCDIPQFRSVPSRVNHFYPQIYKKGSTVPYNCAASPDKTWLSNFHCTAPS